MQGIAKTEKAELERRKKISITMSKKKKTEEHKNKIRQSIDSQKEKRQKIMKQRWNNQEFRKRMLKKRKEQWTQECKSKIKKTLKEKWKEDSFREYMLSSRTTPYDDSGYIRKLKQSRAKQVFPLNDTKIEVKIQNYLKELGIDFFTHQYLNNIKHSYQCDIFIPSLKMVIECDGDYWHKYPIGNEIDHIRTQELIEQGFKVLRMWESEIKVMGINQFKERLEKC